MNSQRVAPPVKTLHLGGWLPEIGYRGQLRCKSFPSSYGVWVTVIARSGLGRVRVVTDDGRKFSTRLSDIHRPELHGEIPKLESA